LLGFLEADVTAAFDAREFNLRQVLGFGFESHVFLEVMIGNLVPTHRFVLNSAVHDKDCRLSFNKNSKAV
jgi:hypothetical protein